MYLPKARTDDRDRRDAAGVPDDIGFATKVALGHRMLARALDAGLAAWATADEFYGGDRGLRRDLQARGLGYVLAVAESHRVDLPIGRLRVDQAVAGLHRRRWNPLSAGKGAKGERD
ncbi:MAG: transposase [Betaproteobacteria bacterium]